MWGRQCYRWSDLDFTANLREGIAVDWPIRYADMAPWYDYVEDFIGISGEALGLPQLPDSKFLPPMAMNCAEQVVQEAMARISGAARTLTIGRVAVLTQTHTGARACHYCGPCERGCITRSYFSSVNATLPAAQLTGRLTLRPFSTVHSLIFDSHFTKNQRRASDRFADAGGPGVSGAFSFSLRVDTGVRAHFTEFGDDGFFCWVGKLSGGRSATI